MPNPALDVAAERARLQPLAAEGLSIREAAQRLGLTRDTVKTRARRCDVLFRRAPRGRIPAEAFRHG